MLQSLSNEIAVTVVARWQPNDLLHAASDLSTYEFCKENGCRFGISLNFHGKVYVFDRNIVLLGSANLTNRGLALNGLSNFEFGTKVIPRDQDIRRLDRFLEEEVVWLNDSLFEKIVSELSTIEAFEPGSPQSKTWSSDVLSLLSRPVSYLWIEELPFCSPSAILNANLENQSVVHDLELLALDLDHIDRINLIAAFQRSRAYKWLHQTISEDDFCSFGKLSSALHQAILDDPTPYRRRIKEYVQILFSWLELMSHEYEITHHRRTTSVTLKRSRTL
jgi:phosphatidylserine/phosphatidylglycerophosphate/cardiolipin synthase-like enzyme